MKIGFYGPSIAKYSNNYDWHFINLLKNKLNAEVVHSGIIQCSEERILFNLKKTKKLDIAFIFHAPPYNIFIPSQSRDITNIDKDTFNKKFKIRDWVKSYGWEYSDDDLECTIQELEKIPNGLCFQLLENFDIDLDNYSIAFDHWVSGNDQYVKDLLKEKISNLNLDDEITVYEELWQAFNLYKKHFHHPDLQMNRYYGAMIQIDQYLSYKKIPCVHILDKGKWYPNWVTFNSGPTEKNLQQLHIETGDYYVGYQKSDNGLNKEGNRIIYERLLELIAVSSIEVDAPSDQLGDGGSIPPAAPNKEV